MKNTKQLLTTFTILVFTTLSISPTLVFADPTGLGSGTGSTPTSAIDCSSNTLTTQQAIQCGTNNAAGASGNKNPTKSLNTTITNIVNLLSAVVGVVAVIMIIVGGFRYITSAGDSNKVTSAKNTLLYAIIGLVIVALAQVIARFVLNNVT